MNPLQSGKMIKAPDKPPWRALKKKKGGGFEALGLGEEGEASVGCRRPHKLYELIKLGNIHSSCWSCKGRLRGAFLPNGHRGCEKIQMLLGFDRGVLDFEGTWGGLGGGWEAKPPKETRHFAQFSLGKESGGTVVSLSCLLQRTQNLPSQMLQPLIRGFVYLPISLPCAGLNPWQFLRVFF